MADEATARGAGAGDPLAAILVVATSPVLLTGVYAWSVAVAPVVPLVLAQMAKDGTPWRAIAGAIAASLAIVPVIAGAFLEPKKPALAASIGIWGFTAFSLAAWLLVPGAVDIARVDPIRGILGCGGFALHALAWGVPRVFRREPPEANPRADTSMPLDARDHLPRASLPAAAAGVVASAFLFWFSWQVRDVPRALLAHATAGLVAVLVTTGASTVSVGLGRWVPSSPRTRLRRATGAILLLALTGVLGVVYAALSTR